jgi:hypothetical protein
VRVRVHFHRVSSLKTLEKWAMPSFPLFPFILCPAAKVGNFIKNTVKLRLSKTMLIAICIDSDGDLIHSLAIEMSR